MTAQTPPEREALYLKELAARLHAVAGEELVGVYVGGSVALGAYDAGRSDLDVAAVVRFAAPRKLKNAIVDAIRHESLPCPARGLEFVLYRLGATCEPSTDAGFELNLNTGAGMDFRADLEPGENESHWFPIDRSILSQHGIALAGPPADEVFAEIPRPLLGPVVLQSLRWHVRTTGARDDAVLNACRALRFAIEGVWSSKPAAAAWVLERRDAPQIVRRALAARHGGERLDPDDVGRFLHDTLAEIERPPSGETGSQA
jgi:hypothetical protein